MPMPRVLSCIAPANQPSRLRGMTAIEVLAALLVISTLSLFVLQVFHHSRRVQLEIHQMDTALQISRDVLEMLRVEKDWRRVDENLGEIKKYETAFTVQLMPQDAPVEGLVGLELTISWVGPHGVEQLVFNTTALDYEVDG